MPSALPPLCTCTLPPASEDVLAPATTLTLPGAAPAPLRTDTPPVAPSLASPVEITTAPVAPLAAEPLLRTTPPVLLAPPLDAVVTETLPLS
jgi:hypothetical protein